MRKFSFAFGKLLHEIWHFFAKTNEAKTCENANCIICSRIFRIVFLRNFRTFFTRNYRNIFSRNFRNFFRIKCKQIDAKFREKAKIFALFVNKRYAKNARNGLKMVVSQKTFN